VSGGWKHKTQQGARETKKWRAAKKQCAALNNKKQRGATAAINKLLRNTKT